MVAQDLDKNNLAVVAVAVVAAEAFVAAAVHHIGLDLEVAVAAVPVHIRRHTAASHSPVGHCLAYIVAAVKAVDHDRDREDSHASDCSRVVDYAIGAGGVIDFVNDGVRVASASDCDDHAHDRVARMDDYDHRDGHCHKVRLLLVAVRSPHSSYSSLSCVVRHARATVAAGHEVRPDAYDNSVRLHSVAHDLTDDGRTGWMELQLQVPVLGHRVHQDRR